MKQVGISCLNIELPIDFMRNTHYDTYVYFCLFYAYTTFTVSSQNKIQLIKRPYIAKD